MRNMTIRVVVLIVLAVVPAAVLAISGTSATELEFETSARFLGLGGAGVAAPWGADTDDWANPALLAFRPGLDFRYFRSRLLPEQSYDFFLRDVSLTLGHAGVTLLLAGGPLGNKQDMGLQEGVDDNNNPTGVFHSYEQSKAWGLGVDAVQLLDAALGHGDAAWSRYGGLAVGVVTRDYEEHFAPDPLLQDPSAGAGSGRVTDLGYVVSATPVHLESSAPVGLTVGAAYGRSRKSDTDSFIATQGAGLPLPFPRAFLRGWSCHLELPLTESFKSSSTCGVRRFLLDAVDPVFSFTYASQVLEPGVIWNASTDSYEYTDDAPEWEREKGHGWEVGLADIFYYRRGYREVPGVLADDTSGWGVHLQLGRLGGARYDHASVPQASGRDVTRWSGSLWFDPVAVYDRLHRGS